MDSFHQLRLHRALVPGRDNIPEPELNGPAFRNGIHAMMAESDGTIAAVHDKTVRRVEELKKDPQMEYATYKVYYYIYIKKLTR